MCVIVYHEMNLLPWYFCASYLNIFMLLPVEYQLNMSVRTACFIDEAFL